MILYWHRAEIFQEGFLQLSMQAQEIAVAIVMNLGEMFFDISLVSSTTKCCLTKLRLV